MSQESMRIHWLLSGTNFLLSSIIENLIHTTVLALALYPFQSKNNWLKMHGKQNEVSEFEISLKKEQYTNEIKIPCFEPMSEHDLLTDNVIQFFSSGTRP